MTKRTVSVLVGAAVLLALGVSVPAVGQSRAIVQSGVGRYQIVNGTPEMTRNIMLLDTVTGDTWVVCGNEKETTGWCPLLRSRPAP
jgi:hypothetical protein